MTPQRFTEQFASMFDLAVRLANADDIHALLVLLEGPTDWDALRKRARGEKILVAADEGASLEGAAEAGLNPVVLNMVGSAVHDKLSQALLEAVADEILEPGVRVVALYGGFEAGAIDSVSIIALSDHLGRLTVRDLRQLETSVPLDTLQTVVNLAVEIGREGREGKPVGAMFVVGDHRKVLASSHSQGFDPMRGYKIKERNIKSARVREALIQLASQPPSTQ